MYPAAGADDTVIDPIMSRLPGRVDWWPPDLDRWLERLAGLLPRIHGTALPPGGPVPRFAPYRQDNYRPPSWARYPRVWERAVEISRGPAPDLPAVLLHSDFHPGNVLWRYGRVSGVVDWPGACSGPAAADVGHCRINLLTMGAEVASRFTVRWEQLAGTTYHPWGDVVTVVGFLDDLRDDWGSERLLVEDMLARAIAELAG